MPVLRNGRHENFAQQIAAGKSTTDAYLLAGYKSSRLKARQHGYRLRTREDITARIQELIDKPQGRIATQQIVEATRTGRPTIYRPELATLARKLALLGATDQEMADALGIDQGTLDRWKTRHKEFCIAIQHGKIRADAEIAQSLYNRARGMSLPAVKIFQGTPEGGPVIVPHQEHLSSSWPSTTALMRCRAGSIRLSVPLKSVWPNCGTPRCAIACGEMSARGPAPAGRPTPCRTGPRCGSSRSASRETISMRG